MKKTIVPYTWQIQVAAQALKEIIALIVDCGCGKTLAGIMLARAKGLPNIVIAPTHRLCEQWKKDIEENDENADVWLYSKPEETKQGEYYKERYEKWLTT